MTKVIDLNGFWKIEDNPITKEGVFPYLGEQISPDLEPKKIYMVYRPASELTNPETIESFNGVPFIDEHEMVGEGFTKYDQRPAGGVLFNPKAENGILVGDFKIFSETMKDEISNGKKELSLGYLCDYELKKGVWNGQYYDAVQKNIRGNHVALVERGRMGSDVRVYDKAITMDSLHLELRKDITKMSQDKDETEWITVNGAHIPIKKEQQKGEAVREFFKNKSSEEKKESDKYDKYDNRVKKIMKWRKEDNLSDETVKHMLEWAEKEFKTSKDSNIPEKQDNPEKSGLYSSLNHKGEDEMADKREAIREIMAIAAKPNSDFEGGETEKIETIAKILEKSEYSKSEAGTANDEDPEAEKDKKGEDKCGKDEDDTEKKAAEDEDEDKKPSEDEDDDKDEKGEDEDVEEKKAAEDEMPRKFLKMIAHRNEIVKAVEPHIGSFACDEMTAQDAAVYACQKLGLQANAKEAELVLRGYLAASKSKVKRYGLDSAVNAESGVDKATVKYLKGE